MSVNDFCRFFKNHLRIRGVLVHTVIIFEINSKDKCVYEQVLSLGLQLHRTAKKSYRICRSCQSLITRLARDMAVFKKWTEDEGNQAEEACSSEVSEKRYREPTPPKTPSSLKKFCPNPSTPTSTKSQRSITESPPSTTSSTWQHTAYTCATRSVSTQLSAGTLRSKHYRSKGVQATVDTICRGTNTKQSLLHFSSPPLKSDFARPPKRPRLDLEEEEDDDLCASIPVSQDSSYEPGDTVTDLSDLIEMESPSEFEDAKYIVFESALRELFDNCPICKRHCVVHQRRCGTFVAFSQDCPHCLFTRKWQSQPMKGNIPQGNLELSAAVYFNGESYTKIQRIFNTMNLKAHRYITYRTHARNLLEPTIYHKWKVDQGTVLEEIKRKGKVAVCGDMRADSPGHSAKFGSYTIMDLEDNKILDIQLVQSNEVGSCVNMEKEGLKRSLDLLESKSVQLDYIVTDRHPQVQKYLRARELSYYYDIWHLVKGLSKKLEALAKKKDCEVVKKWLPGIKSHMYWTACSSTTGSEKVAKWKSLVNHIQNVHEHDDPLFSKCLHPIRASTDRNKWFKPGTVALCKIEKVLLNKRILKDVYKLSSNHQTSSLESFHSLNMRFAPKNVNFSFIGRLCRLYLAALHHNENTKQEQAMAKGKLSWKILFLKSTKRCATARPMKTDATFGYRRDLMELLLYKVLCEPKKFQKELQKVPVPPSLSSMYDGPSKEDVVASQMSGFNPAVAGSQQNGSQHSSLPDLGTPAESAEQHTMG